MRRHLDEHIGPLLDAGKARLLCFSHLRWDFVTQRPQHLMMRAARDFDVVFIEEPFFDTTTAWLQVEKIDGIRVAIPHLPKGNSSRDQDAQLTRLITPLMGCSTSQVFWYYTAAALSFSRDFERALTVYDNMDELTLFKGASPDLIRLERELMSCADLVFTGGRSLYEAKRSLHANVHCFPSSVDVAHFSQARSRSVADPSDQAALPHPRIGYFGVVDERMDLAFVERFAALRPSWQFVLLGPVVKIDPTTLPQRANIHWLGMKSYAELPRYMAHWDLAFMPFALNEATRFISPTKTPEFLSGGLPVISTPVTDVVRTYGKDGLVAITASPEEAAVAADRLLNGPSEEWLARVDACLRAGSWDQTWRAMRERMTRTLQNDATMPVRDVSEELTVEN